MKIGRKLLITAFSAAALVTASVLGTLAYFTDSDSATNTFTVGDIKLELDEAKVNTDGSLVYVESSDGDKTPVSRVTENTYHLLPGHSYIKDPIVHVDLDSEDCYVFVTVDNQIEAIEAETEENVYQTIAKQMSDNGWTCLLDGENPITVKNSNNKDIPVFVYNGNKAVNSILSKEAINKDLIVFEEFQIAGDKVVNRKGTTMESGSASGTDASGNYYIDVYANAEIIVNAYAVQADGFTSALAAWNATFGK